MQEAIWNKFLGQPLTAEERKIVFGIDDDMLHHEFFAHTGYRIAKEDPQLSSNPTYGFVPFEQVEQAFLNAFEELTK